ncbi:PLC-like phosphodiesterase [Dendrothele bispora CBS 962.96]|uniref:PLC-like phosphodiesterase n=1 Tax=Dendrothele bispora (strain CBS 962.96) TaxID=1314807 RepID=A0A4S8MWV5_DENBC|nr:PLC-like phosphodiesterase [Dendrothele bispora CBS 962.96]
MIFRFNRVVQVATTCLLSSVWSVNAAAAVGRRASICNGHSELCDKSYGNVTFIGAHDSYAVGVNNLAVNQDYDVTQQLTDGVRMLQVQAHNNSGTIQLCHTSCTLYNGGTLEDYLGKVKSWMDSNTNDVVTLLIVNIDNLAATEYDTVFKSAGLDSISYAPSSASLTADSWPTLGSMIDSGKRLVTFLDNTADFTSVPYLIDEFTNIWETAFDVTTSFDCEVNRSKTDTSTSMYLINHFLDKVLLGNPVPDVTNANTTNAVSGTNSLGEQVDTCLTKTGKAPNFILVDFYEYGGGSVFQVAATANGVTYDSTSIATPKSTASGSTGSSGSSSSSSSSNSNSAESSRQHWIAALTIVISIAFGASHAL